ncbi:multicopper oxidase domain-containing protein, partial [Escherichia coli]|nr:multicopper oxidase domain-containing protein [Escherichia coli]
MPPRAPNCARTSSYWYHSHSGLQEQEGVYGAIII